MAVKSQVRQRVTGTGTVRIGVGDLHIAAEGAGPDDGFT